MTIEPDGSWSLIRSTSPFDGTRKTLHGDDDEEDIVEIQGMGPPRRATFPTPVSGTPTVSSREPSVPSTAISSGSKRPRGAIVDLTLTSSDEEDDPPRDSKRLSFMSRPSNGPQARISSSIGGSSGAGILPSRSVATHTLVSPSNLGNSRHGFELSFPR